MIIEVVTAREGREGEGEVKTNNGSDDSNYHSNDAHWLIQMTINNDDDNDLIILILRFQTPYRRDYHHYFVNIKISALLSRNNSWFRHTYNWSSKQTKCLEVGI